MDPRASVCADLGTMLLPVPIEPDGGGRDATVSEQLDAASVALEHSLADLDVVCETDSDSSDLLVVTKAATTGMEQLAQEIDAARRRFGAADVDSTPPPQACGLNAHVHVGFGQGGPLSSRAIGCEQCDGAVSTHFCQTCGELCRACVAAHSRMRCLQSHNLVALVQAQADANRSSSPPLEPLNWSVLPTPAQADRRTVWHWRWSESLPTSPSPDEHTPCRKPAAGPWSIGHGVSADGTRLLDGPRSLAVANGSVYVCDTEKSKVQVFDSADGRFVRSIGGEVGSGEGTLDCPMAVVADDFLVYVSDFTSHRVQVYSAADGRFLQTMGEGVGCGQGQLLQPSGLSLDGKGNLFVADLANNRIQRFSCPHVSFLHTHGAGGARVEERHERSP